MHTNSEEKYNAASPGDDEALLKTARMRFDLAVEAEAQIRKDALDDLKFRAGEQWPDDVKRMRDADSRPSLTINRIPQFIRQITNDQRQNRPSVKVDPVDDRADIDTAKVIQGIIRHIEYNSNADTAYDTAFEGGAGKGLGYWRIVTDYANPTSFEQEIFIKRIRNSFSVYIDPGYQEADASDMNWGFIFEDMSLDEYKAQYKNSKLASMTDYRSIGDMAPGWVSANTIRVSEYFYKSFEEVTICLLSNGRTVEKSKLPAQMPDGFQVVAERTSILPAIKWCKINAVEVLERTDWPGKWIPIIPVFGDELDVDGKRILEGVIRHAKDPQRMYNYWASSETEMIALAPRAPFIGVEGQFEGHEEKWKSANRKNHAYLEYKSKSLNGQPVGPPQRNVYEAPVGAITQARMQSAEDLKATTGIYDSSLGAKSNENSGVAIEGRVRQSQTSNFHFIDNLSRALRHSGRVILDLIPHVYDTERAVRALGEDGAVDIVQINKIFDKDGKSKIYRFDVGQYDVTITTGPSFATKRQEAVQSMLSLTQSYPKVAEVAGDLMVRNMDWPGAQEIADRLKKTLPPGIADDKDPKAQAIPPQIQAQIQQMTQMIDQLTKELHATSDIIDNKKLELESRERIENLKVQANIEIELARIGSQEAQTLLKQEIGAIQHRLNLIGVNDPIESVSTGSGAQVPQPPMNQPPGGLTPGQPPGGQPPAQPPMGG